MISKSRKLIITFSLLILYGCETDPLTPISEVNEVRVMSKNIKEYRGTTDEYFITVEKNGTKATFKVNETDFNTVNENSIINGKYYENGVLKEITFPDLK